LNRTLYPNVKRRIRAGIVVAPIVLASFLVPAVVVGAAPPASTVELAISKFAFAPKEITVAPGTTIVWVNRDEAPHTVVAEGRSFVSKGLDTDDRFAHAFEREGDFNYICSVHPFMTGVVHVRKR
jgi:plastocyanin